MNKELNGFDEMVEALEENEDMVECKECFDLFPKAECERSEVGYVCPVCKGLRTAPAQARFVDPYDCYTQEFPEVKDYNPDSVVEYEREPDLGDALNDLIKDEYEAIDGYEIADEKIQHAAIDADQKDEILDTLDHIKEEEEEHIDELKELCPECDLEDETDPVSEKEPSEEEDLDELFDANVSLNVDGGENNDVSVLSSFDPEASDKEKLDELLDANVNLSLDGGAGNKVNVLSPLGGLAEEIEAADEEVEEIPEEDIPEEEAEDSEENENEEVSDLDSAYEAALEIANESGVGQVFGYAKKDTEEFVAIEPFEVDDPEAVEDDLMAVYDDVAYAYVAYPEKSLEESLFESVQLNEGPRSFFKSLGQKMGNAANHRSNKASGKVIDKFFNEGYILVFEGPKDGMPTENKEEYETADQALTAGLQLSKEYPKYKVWVFAKPIDTSDLTPREKNLANVKNGLGAVIACFRNGTVIQKKDKELVDALKKIEIDKQDLKKTTGKTAGENNSDPRDAVAEDPKDETPGAEEPHDEDPNLDDDEDTVDPKENAKKMLGEKKAADGYTPESYKKYEVAYGKIVAWIETFNKPETLTQERIDNLRKKAEAKLVAVPDEDPNLDDEEVAGDPIPEAPADADTGSEDAADGEEDKPTDGAEEAPAEETPAEEAPAAESAEGVGKLSEVSEEQLKKLFTAVTGQGVGDNKKWQKVLKRMRAKLQELGESLDPNDYKPEDFIEEDLQSEADALKSLKDTEATLKSTVDGIKNMTSAMREEYHRYANPAELAAMKDVEELITKALANIYDNLTAWGYEAEEVDGQSFMSQEDEACLQYMVNFQDLSADEIEDLADQIQMQLENELSAYKLVPEIRGLSGSVALPDYDLADEDDDAEGITRASIMVYVTFARNLY